MSLNLRVLLLEDDAEDALLFRKFCPAGFAVTRASTPEQALELVDSQAFDICFSDYLLCGRNGLDFVRQMRRTGRRMPVIVITGQDVETLGENALLAGATDFMRKDDISASQIMRAARWALIRRHVDERQTTLGQGRALLAQLGALTSGPIALNPGRQALRRLLYVSRATTTPNLAECLDMSTDFAYRNATLGITGYLAQAGDFFLQIIEGPPAVAGDLLGRIRADARHDQLTLIMDQAVSERLFNVWRTGRFDLRAAGAGSAALWTAWMERLREQTGSLAPSASGIGQFAQALVQSMEPTEAAAASEPVATPVRSATTDSSPV
ncbi:MAG: hypothetical protein CMN28_14825 [Salinisphaeraceae bacterium]|nr:hypothetical protein [Salinisphaeraceae bacterium]